jgi:hypothetical protein
MAKSADKTSTHKQPQDGQNQDVLSGSQSLTTGLVYDADGNAIIPEIEDQDNVLEVQQIGVYRRVVYTDGRVATTQTEPVDQSSEIGTPVPLPGDVQDQTGSGLADPIPAEAPASVK